MYKILSPKSNYKIVFIPDWKRESLVLFDEIARHCRDNHADFALYYLVIQDHAYHADWRTTEALDNYTDVFRLQSRYDGTVNSQKNVSAELKKYLSEINPDLICLPSDYFPAQDIIAGVCGELAIKVCIIQNGLPHPFFLPSDHFLSWSEFWHDTFFFPDTCIKHSIGCFAYDNIVSTNPLAKVYSETCDNDEIILALSLPETQVRQRLFLEALYRFLEEAPPLFQFVIPAPAKGKDIPLDLIFARNNVSYLPQLIDDEFLLRRADIFITRPDYSAFRSTLSNIHTIVLNDHSDVMRYFDRNIFHIVEDDELNDLFTFLAANFKKLVAKRRATSTVDKAVGSALFHWKNCQASAFLPDIDAFFRGMSREKQ
jgi:hypothetical protein